jgi:Sec-independent protein translocase protein TatA
MEILGIGMPELLFILVIALIILGPKDMQKAGKTIGTFLRKLVTSDGWKVFQDASREIRYLPNRLMREANQDLKQVENEIRQSTQLDNKFGSWANPGGDKEKVIIQTPDSPPEVEQGHKITPPNAEAKSSKREDNA